MRIEEWAQKRETPGTLAHAARQLLEKEVSYRAAGRALRRMYFLELVLKHGGNQSEAARSIGLKQEQVNREMRSMGITATNIRTIVKRLQGRPDGDGSTATAA